MSKMECMQVGNKKIVALILVLLLVFSGGMVFNQILASPGNDEILIEPDSYVTESSYVVFKDGSDFKMRNGTSGEIDWESTDDDAVIQASIDNATVSGGSVYVKSAVYSASVTLKDNVTLWFERGVSGITVSVDSGADCALVDEENGFRKEYVSGVLYSFMDYHSGEFWYGGENRTDLIVNPTDTASYIVESDGTDTWMTNCSTGQRDAYSTNGTEITNWALGNLTSGRDMQETVYLKGNLTLDKTGTIDSVDYCVSVSSYTKIVIDGKLTMADNADAYMFVNSGGNTSSQVDVEISGGVIDCNKANQASGGYIHWRTIGNSDGAGQDTGLWCHHQRIYFVKDYGIIVNGTAGVAGGAKECRFESLVMKNGGTGVYLMSASDCVVSKVWINGMSDYMLHIFGGGGHTISDCYFGGQGINNVRLEICGAISFANCIADSAGEHGIYISSSAGKIMRITWVGGRITNNGRDSAGTYSGVYIEYGSSVSVTGAWIGNNVVPNHQKHAFEEKEWGAAQTDYNLVEGNIFYNHTDVAVVIYGDNTIVRDNVGFVTENSGTATDCVNGTYVSHGLASTPNQTLLTISGSNYINSTCYLIAPSVIASNSTHFQIGFYIYNADTITAVTATDQRDIYWEAIYKP